MTRFRRCYGCGGEWFGGHLVCESCCMRIPPALPCSECAHKDGVIRRLQRASEKLMVMLREARDAGRPQAQLELPTTPEVKP